MLHKTFHCVLYNRFLQIKAYTFKKNNSSYQHWFSLSSCLCWWARLNRLLVSAASISSISQRRSSRIAVRIRRRSSMSIVLSSWKNREQVSLKYVKILCWGSCLWGKLCHFLLTLSSRHRDPR